MVWKLPEDRSSESSGYERSAQYWLDLVSPLLESRAEGEAWSVCQQALTEHPHSPELLVSAAAALMKLDRADEAELYVTRAAALRPQSPVIWNNLGVALRNQNRLAEAIQCFETAIQLDPDSGRPHYDRAFSLLLAGDYARGWPDYEYRWQAHGLERPGDDEPAMRQRLWNGKDATGKRILLYAEQGLGDTIQFARYIAPLQARGADVVLEVQPALRGLMQWLRPECEVGTGQALPPFDLHCPLLTLPMLFATTPETIPPPAAFAIPDALSAKWQAKIPMRNRLRVGLVWAGNPGNPRDDSRSAHFAIFEPLFNDPMLRESVQFFGLQVGARTDEKDHSPYCDLIYDLRPELTAPTETAAALLQLDLVITVDTFVAHLAASLGVKVWVLLSFAPDWRWLLERHDSPWYPAMRLFRQRAAGDWAGVAALVHDQLSKLCSTASGR